MSWRVLLSEYPESILSDELSLVLLALVERFGMVTEDDLQARCTLEKRDLVRRLLALHQDKFIQYTRHYIRLSDRGKELLNRFSLNTEIVDDLLATLDLPSSQQRLFRDAMLHYRDRAFSQYVESVTAVRSWARTCSRGPFAASPRSQETQVGALAIVLADLESWSRAVVNPPEEHQMGQFLSAFYREISESRPVNPALRAARDWLETVRQVEKSDTPWRQLRQTSEPARCVFVAHQHTRHLWDMSSWLDQWSPNGSWLVVLDGCESGSEAVKKIGDFASSEWSTRPLQVIVTTRHPEQSNPIGRVFGLSTGDFLVKLMTAHSLQQLAATTSLSHESLKRLLTGIKDKCSTLLEAHEKPQATESPAAESD